MKITAIIFECQLNSQYSGNSNDHNDRQMSRTGFCFGVQDIAGLILECKAPEASVNRCIRPGGLSLRALGFRIYGLGFGMYGLGFTVQGKGLSPNTEVCWQRARKACVKLAVKLRTARSQVQKCIFPGIKHADG